MTTIELLYVDACPGAEQLLHRLRELLEGEPGGTTLELRLIESQDDALRERFLGSPTLRIDGRDIEPGADARTDFGLQCRLYPSPSGPLNSPPDDWVRIAVAGW